MKSITAIFIASLCLFAHATSVFENESFVQLKSNPFGNLLTTLIQVNMAADHDTGRLNEIDDLLNQVVKSLEDQVQSNEDTISTNRGWCTKQRNEIQGNIDSSQTDLDNDNKENNDLTVEKETKQTELEHEQGDLKTNSDNKDAAEKNLVDENTRNDIAVKDYAEAIDACKRSLSLLQTLQSSTISFIQTKAQFANVVSLLQRHLSNKSSPMIEPVISVLTELASEASVSVDQAKLANIVNLINQLLNELSAQEAANVVRHNNTVSDINGQITNLETLIGQNNDAIKRATDRLDNIEKRQTELDNLIESLNKILPTYRESLKNTNDQCNGYEKTYLETKGKLNGEQDALEKVRIYFNDHIVPSVSNIDDDVYQDSVSHHGGDDKL